MGPIKTLATLIFMYNPPR